MLQLPALHVKKEVSDKIANLVLEECGYATSMGFIAFHLSIAERIITVGHQILLVNKLEDYHITS